MAYIYKKFAERENGIVTAKTIYEVKFILSVLIVTQWNLISYIFPERDFWGYTPLFILLGGFFFDSKFVLLLSIGVGVSMFISWAIKPELLPEFDSSYTENILLRCAATTISGFLLYQLTKSGESFKKEVEENTARLEEQNKHLQLLNRDIINFTANLVEDRDFTTGQHVKRVKYYTSALAKEVMIRCPNYGLTAEDIEMISQACVLHDVGKIRISDVILLKKGKLTPEEFAVIKQHTIYGVEIIDKLPAEMDEDFIKCCREICLYHHERYDGRGYPFGLRGDDIPISAMLTALADCYDALTSDRPYKDAYSKETALQMILNGECGAFPEDILQCFETVVNSQEYPAR